MIPKIIHFCWLSNDPYPEKIKYCMDSWKKKLPDYEFIHWNFDRFPRGTSLWVDQAFDNHKYAFAADFIRMYALYHYGGIYLDTDVEVLKSFNELLRLPYFIGRENSKHGIEAAIIGSEKNAEWVKHCLDYYKDRKFVLGLGKFDDVVLPRIMSQILSEKYTIVDIDGINSFDYDSNIICRFPVDWFSPKSWDTGEVRLSKNTYAIHHFSGSWIKPASLSERIRKMCGKLLRNIRNN